MEGIVNWEKLISSANLDPEVGIAIAKLTGDVEFAMYVTRISPGKKVGAHAHSHGHEIYQILEGTGTISMSPENGAVKTDRFVSKGDFFTIPPGTFHQLKNTGTQDLILVFGCPETHLSTDRILATSDLI